MTEDEKRNFLALASSRAPGKRQIKPNANILLDAIPFSDSDEDDDFVAGRTGDEFSSNSDLSSNDGNAEIDGRAQTSDSSDSSCEPEKHRNEDTKLESSTSGAYGCNIQPGQLICTLCLNQRAVVLNDEVIQCDKCGVAVHENCYITENVGDAESDGSSSSTEPWFCEACLYGLEEPPYCELCPNRFGAFKKAGITFGDVERLSAVSWQEEDYKLFGKRACVACSDPLLARTGIAVPCDAALCKNHLHVTCAQRLGLLIDNTEKSADPNLSNSTNTNNNNLTTYDVETVDPLYLTCKRHANENLMRQRKAICELVYKQEESRMLGIRRRVLSEREERKRVQMLERHKKALKDLEGITIAWPEHDNKRPRLFHTSAQYLELFFEKAKSTGISRQKFLENFIKVDGAQLPYLPPGFSREFIEYFNYRKNVIPKETEKLEKLKQENEKLRTEQKKLQELLQKPLVESFDDSKVLQEWYETLHALGLRKIEKPSAPAENKAKKNMPKKSQSFTAGRSPSISKAPTSKGRRGKKKSADDVAIQGIELKINLCDGCKKTTEQHLMTQCDKCHMYYHLACLDPPLMKMPKKTSTQGWICSVCCDLSSESDAETAKISYSGPRKLRGQSSASEKRKEAMKAECKASMISAIQPQTDNKCPIKTTPLNSPDETKKTVSASAMNHSTSTATATIRKRRVSDRSKRHSFGDYNGIHQHNLVAKRVPSLSPVPQVAKRKRHRSVNSLPPTLPKFK